MFINVTNEEINKILTTILNRAEEFINSSGLWYVDSNFSEWRITVIGYQENNNIHFVDRMIVYEAINKILIKYQLIDFIKIYNYGEKGSWILDINYYNITEEEFNKYITLCKLYDLY